MLKQLFKRSGTKTSKADPPISFGANARAGATVKLGDAEIYYETYGKGQPMLLLHGNGQSIVAFSKQIGEFAKYYKVIAVDTRGDGNSIDKSIGPLSYAMFADDMKALLDALKIKSAHILGWSDGGITALIMAMKYPGYIKKLAVMAANIFPAPKVFTIVMLNELKQQSEQLYYKKDDKSVRQKRLIEMMMTEPKLTLNDLATIKSPVLVLAGEDDLIKEEHTKAIAANISGAQLSILKGADHFAPYSDSINFNEAVLAYFK